MSDNAFLSSAIASQTAPVPPPNTLVKSSFYFTYVFLLTTGVITFIEAIRTKNPSFRHIMNLETCISMVAAFFYSQFTLMIQNAESKGDALPVTAINLTRYTDWAITTPMMLLVLCTVLAMESKSVVHFSAFAVVILLDVLMLWAGYLGEVHKMQRTTACFLGFVCFALMFGYIWLRFMGKKTFGALLSFYMFLGVWSIYGVVYMLDEEKKNVSYNVLDLIAKALIGLFFWMYYAHVMEF